MSESTDFQYYQKNMLVWLIEWVYTIARIQFEFHIASVEMNFV